jgi:hypothetical protein
VKGGGIINYNFSTIDCYRLIAKGLYQSLLKNTGERICLSENEQDADHNKTQKRFWRRVKDREQRGNTQKIVKE